jgi:hypothetical protein
MTIGVPTLLVRPPKESEARRKLEGRTTKFWREMVDNDRNWEQSHRRVIRHFSRSFLEPYFKYRRACMRFRVAFAVLTALPEEPLRTNDFGVKLAGEYSWFTRGEYLDACTVVARIVNGPPKKASLRLATRLGNVE